MAISILPIRITSVLMYSPSVSMTVHIVILMVLCTTLCQALKADEQTGLKSENKLTIQDSQDSGYYEVKADGQPNHETDEFPTNYNPNSIESQDHSYKIPKEPSVADSPSCLPMGTIGLTRSGVPFFSPYTSEQKNAVEGPDREEFDPCDGHPDRMGVYHYHKNPTCIPSSSQPDAVVGVAMDGFPIYSKYRADGTVLTSKDLDACHGRFVDGDYRYHLTEDFPYVLGCFKGKLHSDYNRQLSGRNCQTAISEDANEAAGIWDNSGNDSGGLGDSADLGDGNDGSGQESTMLCRGSLALVAVTLLSLLSVLL